MHMYNILICMYYRRIRAEIVCIPDAPLKRNQVSPLSAFSRPTVVTQVPCLNKASKRSQRLLLVHSAFFTTSFRTNAWPLLTSRNLDKREASWYCGTLLQCLSNVENRDVVFFLQRRQASTTAIAVMLHVLCMSVRMSGHWQ